jgi:type VI secretion system protein ImpJ
MGMRAHEIPDSIQWHEGLLLTPQHFQQLTLRHEALLQYSATAIAPFYWGVRYFKVDSTSLVGGMLRISDLEAVMPDCLVVSQGLRQDDELNLDLTPYVNEMKERPLPVYLAVPARETDSLTKGDIARYYSFRGDPVVDESTGEGQTIPRLAPRLSLLPKEKPPGKYVSFPLLEVVFKNGSFALSDDFIPPTPMVAPSSPLGILCAMVARRVREKAMYLTEQASSPSSGGGMRLDLETRSLIRSLVTGLPSLEALLNTGVAHPFQIYLALCSMVGHLAVLGTISVPPVLAPYDHDDLRFTFDQVTKFIFRMIDEGAVSAYKVYPFRYRDGVYELTFDGTWMSKRLIIGIKGQTGMSERDVINWGQECLISSEKKLQSMRENRILGARREQIERAEDLVPPRGAVLFSMRPDPESVEPNEILQIFNKSVRSGAMRPSEIVLYVRNTE